MYAPEIGEIRSNWWPIPRMVGIEYRELACPNIVPATQIENMPRREREAMRGMLY